MNEQFKELVAIPYFKDIYKDLALQSDNRSKGVNKFSILNVSSHLKPATKASRNSKEHENPMLA